MIRNQAGQLAEAQMVSAGDGSAFTGAVTVYVKIDNGTQTLGATGGGAATHAGNGLHSYQPTAAETDGALIAFTFIGSGAIPATVQYPTLTAPQAAAAAGVTAAAPQVTVRDLCTAALQRLGVLAAAETPSSEDLVLALNRLNTLISSWRTQKLFNFALVRTTFTITANDGVYTLGPGGDINIPRPVFPYAVRLVDTTTSPSQEMTIGLLGDAAYAALPQKSLTSSWPTHVYYNPTSPLATLTFYPVPTAATLQGVVYTPNASAALALTDVLQLPDGYELFYQENLAVHLAADFDRQPSPILIESAREARADIKRANVRRQDMTVLTPFSGGGDYDIWSDQVF